MIKFLLTLLIIFLHTFVVAQDYDSFESFDVSDESIVTQTWPYQLRFPDTSVIDNGDWTTSIDFAAGIGATICSTCILFEDGAGSLAGDSDFTYVPGAPDLFSTNADGSITGSWTFNPNGAGGITDYDIEIGDTDGTPTYGIIRIGNAIIGRTSYNTANMDLDGAILYRNVGGPITGNLEHVFTESTGSSTRFALPKSGAGLGTYNSRSMIIAGPAPADTDYVMVSYWQTNNNIFDNLAMDTSGTGADLGVQNDLEVEGDIFVDSIKESTTGVGVSFNDFNIKNVGDVELDSLTADGANITSASPWSLSGTWTWIAGGIHLNDNIALTHGNIVATPDLTTSSDGTDITSALANNVDWIFASDGDSDLFTLSGTDDNVIIGVASDTADGRNKLDLRTSSVTTGILKGGSFVVTQTPASAGFSSPRGVVGDVMVGGVNWNAGNEALGLSFNILAASNNSGNSNIDLIGVNTSLIADDLNLTAGDAIGMRAKVGAKVITGATFIADNFIGFKSVGNVLSGASVTNTFGFFSEAPTDGAIGNAYGMYIENTSVVSNGGTLNRSNGIWIEGLTEGGLAIRGIVLDGDGAGSDVIFGAGQEHRIFSESSTELAIQPTTKVTIGDGTTDLVVESDGDTFWTGSGSGLFYGNMDQDDTSFNVTLTTQNVWVELDAATTNIVAGPLNDVTFDGDHYLKVNTAGTYMIVYSLVSQINSIAGGNQHIEFQVFLNSGVSGKGSSHVTYVASVRDLPAGSTTILSLDANDEISIGARNTISGGKVITIDHVEMSILKIGGTPRT